MQYMLAVESEAQCILPVTIVSISSIRMVRAENIAVDATCWASLHVVQLDNNFSSDKIRMVFMKTREMCPMVTNYFATVYEYARRAYVSG